MLKYEKWKVMLKVDTAQDKGIHKLKVALRKVFVTFAPKYILWVVTGTASMSIQDKYWYQNVKMSSKYPLIWSYGRQVLYLP